MTITARDIQLKQFKVKFRGFDVQEVDFFLDQLAEGFTNLEIDNRRMAESLKNAKIEIEELKVREEKLKRAYQELKKNLVSLKDEAQISSNQNTSRMIITEAQRESERILDEARTRVERLNDDIQDLRKQKEMIDDHIRKAIELGKAILKNNDCPTNCSEDNDLKVKHLRQIP